MATGKIHSSSIANSALLLMNAMRFEVLPSVDDLYKDGWITATDYCRESGVAYSTAKRWLNSSKNIQKKKAKDVCNVVMMYKAGKVKDK